MLQALRSDVFEDLPNLARLVLGGIEADSPLAAAHYISTNIRCAFARGGRGVADVEVAVVRTETNLGTKGWARIGWLLRFRAIPLPNFGHLISNFKFPNVQVVFSNFQFTRIS